MFFQDEPDSDAKDRFRTRIGEWKTSDKKGVYGEAKEVGGIHGDDIAQSAVSYHTLVDTVVKNFPNDLTKASFKLLTIRFQTGRTEEDLYKRFAESQGANKVVDTTGHRI